MFRLIVLLICVFMICTFDYLVCWFGGALFVAGLGIIDSYGLYMICCLVYYGVALLVLCVGWELLCFICLFAGWWLIVVFWVMRLVLVVGNSVGLLFLDYLYVGFVLVRLFCGLLLLGCFWCLWCLLVLLTDLLFWVGAGGDLVGFA